MSLADGSAAAKGEITQNEKLHENLHGGARASLLAAGNIEARAQPAQQTADQAKADANATKPVEKKDADGSPATKKSKTNNSVSTTRLLLPLLHPPRRHQLVLLGARHLQQLRPSRKLRRQKILAWSG